MSLLEKLFHPQWARVFRWLLEVGAVLVILWGFFWNFSGPIIEVYADDIFEKKLRQFGVSPEEIAEMKNQGERNGVNIIDLGSDAEQIKAELQRVKDQARAISGKQDQLSAQTTRIEGQVDRIVDALIGERNP